MKYFLVPDVHGELDMVAGLLLQEGLLDDSFERIQLDVNVIQIGDLLNCVGRSINDDNRCLDHEHWFDVLLVGNHEHPYFGGPAFSGFHYDMVMNHRLKLLDSQGRYKVAVDCDGILVTHAGLVTYYYEKMFAGCTVASSSVAEELNDLWDDPMNKGSNEFFSAIGWDRGGYGKWGGILWADWTQYKTPKLKQIVGHSVGEGVRVQINGYQYGLEKWNKKFDWEALCIDLGAGKHSPTIVGAWIEDGNVKLVEYTEE